MGRRHSSKTGDGGGEKRHGKSQELLKKNVEPALVFHDDPSSSDNEQGGSESDMESEEELLPLDSFGVNNEDDFEEDFNEQKEEIDAMSKAWGSSKSDYYNADEIDEEESEAGEEEEEAALELQAAQLEELEEDDFTLSSFLPTLVEDEEIDVMNKLKGIIVDSDEEEVETIAKDLSSLTKSEKLKFLGRNSPELLGLAQELQERRAYVDDVLTPLQDKMEMLASSGQCIDATGLRFVQLQRALNLQYCTNIVFYLLAKAKEEPLKDHPVMAHLMMLKAAIAQYEPLEKQLKEQAQAVLECVVQTVEMPDIQDGMDDFFGKRTVAAPFDASQVEAVVAPTSTKSKRKVSKEEEEAALAFYENIVSASDSVKKARTDFFTHEGPIERVDSIGDNEKRSATYQIMKNRGLTAHKNKLNRNPRVKKRMQYRKAVIRRKGQVREVRTGEAASYGGELSGIKSNITKSRKLRN